MSLVTKIQETVLKLGAKGRPNPFAARSYGTLQHVTPRVYLWRNITNSSFVVGADAVAVIDTQVNLSGAQMLLAAIRSVTSKPIRYVVNTHYHWDHTNGNALFKREGATVVASKKTLRFMTERSSRQKEFLSGRGFELGADPFLPEETFEGEKVLALGGADLRLFYAGSAETEDATAVHVPSENVLMSGDTVMTGSFPIFGQPVWDEGLEGDGVWQKTLMRLLELKPDHILPGHGPLAHEADVGFLLRIEDYFTKEVRSRVRLGMSLKNILSDLESRMPGWITSIPVVWGTPRYAILRVWRGLTKTDSGDPGWQQFKPSALPAAKLPKRAEAVVKAAKPGKEAADLLAMAHEAREGGDRALQIAVLAKASSVCADSDEVQCVYADALIEGSRAEPSVLEKGDFLSPARAAWERVLARNPGYPRALLGKGRYHVMLAFRGGDDPSHGIELLEKLLATAPDARLRAEAEFYLGIAARRLGDEARAKEKFAAALKADPGFMPARIA